jgi:putative nucleotidyltransferase with HDIG domain
MQSIKYLFNTFGHSDYIGENVSQKEHMLQCATLAYEYDKDNHNLITACLLHDIGQLVSLEKEMKEKSSLGSIYHENIGANFLSSLHFSQHVIDLVKNHVKAKRYLISTDESYFSNLSQASVGTLQFQGGKMTEEEIKNFEKLHFFKDVIQLRKFDDKAKDPNFISQNLDFFQSILEKCIKNSSYK